MNDIFLTGGAGFVGGHILARLLESGRRVRCLVKPGSEAKLKQETACFGDQMTIVSGDVRDPARWRQGLQGCEAVIHLVGIIREIPARDVTFERLHVEATRHVLEAAREAGVGRVVHMSALGARAHARARYHQTKFAAEELVRASGLTHVIFRPSIIFGPEDEFVNLLARLIHKKVPVPVIGPGNNRLQPVAVENVAHAFVDALSRSEADNRTFEICGPQPYSLNDLIDAIARAKGLPQPLKIHIPLALVEPAVWALQNLSFFPVTSDQLLMLMEDNVCDAEAFRKTFGIELTDFEAGIARYLK